ncbi:MAG: helix-turn-helix transcriptional regulator [Spirochaetaceae bacterium]|nr:helix-turn-helix transcriptional regulator [Spirochaetaceae bacterium]MBO5236958.1 helix-turn-helix transcriptional regulator [Spirochaetaceae bacterium]
MNLQTIFISNMKRFRKQKHITQEKLAEMCGTDTCYIGQIETFRRFPSIQLIEKISVALEVEAWVLFKNNETTEYENKKEEKINVIKDKLSVEFDQVLSRILKETL